MIEIIKVWPKNEAIARVMRHPTAGGFQASDGAGNWPRDAFTIRRLQDGDVTETPPVPTE